MTELDKTVNTENIPPLKADASPREIAEYHDSILSETIHLQRMI